MAFGIVRDIFAGFIIAKLWLWFILGRFTDLQVNMWHAVGLMLFISIFSYVAGITKKPDLDTKTSDDKKKDALNEAIANSIFWKFLDIAFVYPWFLLVCYVWHQFI